MTGIVMPRLSDTMEEGTILRWLKRDGEQVSRGEELVEIETDKATMSYESDESGVLQTLAAEGDTLAVGALIARVGEASAQAQEDEEPASRPAAVREAVVDRERAGASAGQAEADGAPARAVVGARRKASPIARRLARESGVDLATLAGSGPGGRIVRADVVAAGAGQAERAPDQAVGCRRRAAAGARRAQPSEQAGGAVAEHAARSRQSRPAARASARSPRRAARSPASRPRRGRR